MKKLKSLLMSFIFVLSVVTASVFGVIKTSAIANAAEEPTEIESVADVNDAISMIAGENVKSFIYSSFDEAVYNSVSEDNKISLIDPADQVLYFWVVGDVLNYSSTSGGNVGLYYLPETCDSLFDGFENVEKIDLSGFDDAMVSSTEGVFANCSSLKEVVFTSSTTTLLNPLKVLWENKVYNQEGEVVESLESLTEPVILTNVKQEKAYFDFRDGNGVVNSTTYNPTLEGFEFYGWSTEIDGETVLTKSNGENYTEEDFVGGETYYAVYKNGGKIVLTQSLNLTTAKSNTLTTYGYELNGTALTINGLTIRNCSNTSAITVPSNVTKISVNGTNVITAVNNISSPAIFAEALDLESNGSLTISKYANGISSISVVSIEDVTLNVTATNTALVAGEILTVSSGEIIALSTSSETISAGILEISGGSVNVTSEYTTAIIVPGNMSITGGIVKIQARNDNKAVDVGGELDINPLAVVKTGENEASAVVDGDYNKDSNKEFVMVNFHKFTYSVVNDVIVATCLNSGCVLDENKVSVSFSITNKTYDGNAIVAYVYGVDFQRITGKTVLVEFEGVGDTAYSKSTNAPVNAGTYKASFTVEGAVVYKNFEILKANATLDAAPTAKTVVFNGNAQELVNAGVATNGTVMYRVTSGGYATEYAATIPTGVAAETYRVYYKVVGNENYNNIAESYIDVEIAQKEVVIDWCEDDFIYNGNTQTITATYKDVSGTDVALNVSVEGIFKNVGEYTATVSFKFEETNYKLPSDVTETFDISKLKINKPAENNNRFVYTGSALVYELTESEYYTISGNSKTEVCEYDVVVALNDTANTEWNDSTITNLTFKFVINKITINEIEDASGNVNTNVVIQNIENGINPDAKVVVEDVDVSKQTEKTRLQNILNLSANKEISSAVDIKIISGGNEIQSTGKVSLKIKVPENIKSKNFELYHIHGNDSSKLTYSAIDTQGYVSIEVENFSEFVFVVETPSATVVPPAEESSGTPWIILGVLGLFLLLFFLWFFVFKKQKYDVVSKIVVSVFEMVAVVLLCVNVGTDLMAYAIVNLVSIIGVDFIYMINTSKDKQKIEQEKIEPQEVQAQ